MKNMVFDELCGRYQCKFKSIDDHLIILLLKNVDLDEQSQ